jgi:hypothetical protein
MMLTVLSFRGKTKYCQSYEFLNRKKRVFHVFDQHGGKIFSFFIFSSEWPDFSAHFEPCLGSQKDHNQLL